MPAGKAAGSVERQRRPHTIKVDALANALGLRFA
jgi:hypothetical protein